MAQLDKLLSVMISNRADELVLTEGAAAVLLSQGNERPVTKALTAPQIVALLKEIAPAPVHVALDAKQPTKFQYMSEDSVFAARAMVLGDGKLSVRIQVDADGEFKRSTGMFTRVVLPEEASAPSAAAAMPNVKEAAVDPAGAREAMEKLLRMLVEQGGSDLHMRVGEPPILRKSGEMHRVEGQPKIDPATMEALLLSIMPERNQKEFKESNDTDFAYEIAGVARFRANVLRDRKGVAAVFRVIPNTIITADQLGISQEVQNLCYLTKGL
ncbi:MAG: hypothetical protein C0503_07710, partial [Gemmatimonas sp.]|nr:hypothetical protein [Gemmatimonas sp.]